MRARRLSGSPSVGVHRGMGQRHSHRHESRHAQSALSPVEGSRPEIFETETRTRTGEQPTTLALDRFGDVQSPHPARLLEVAPPQRHLAPLCRKPMRSSPHHRRARRSEYAVSVRRTVKYFNWDEAKNAKLRMERGIGFEDIGFHIERGDLLDIVSGSQRVSLLDSRMLRATNVTYWSGVQ